MAFSIYLRLLRKEVLQAKGDLLMTEADLQKILKQKINARIIPSTILHTRHEVRKTRRPINTKLNKTDLCLTSKTLSFVLNLQIHHHNI